MRSIDFIPTIKVIAEDPVYDYLSIFVQIPAAVFQHTSWYGLHLA